MNVHISVCVCTWNRAGLLDQTLTAMRGLRIPRGLRWELLVVNNNSTDLTDEVIARHAGPLPIRRLFEPKQGHSHSRNCAVNAAAGDLIPWTDDDVLVDPEWLAEYAEVSRRWPQASFFGGTIDPWFSVGPPGWIRRNLGSLTGPFAIAQYGDTVRPFGPGEGVTGANMGFRREVYGLERYDPKLGRVAGSLLSGDDTEFVGRLKDGGPSASGSGRPGSATISPRSGSRRTIFAAGTAAPGSPGPGSRPPGPRPSSSACRDGPSALIANRSPAPRCSRSAAASTAFPVSGGRWSSAASSPSAGAWPDGREATPVASPRPVSLEATRGRISRRERAAPLTPGSRPMSETGVPASARRRAKATCPAV